jgi:hypothetical protein
MVNVTMTAHGNGRALRIGAHSKIIAVFSTFAGYIGYTGIIDVNLHKESEKMKKKTEKCEPAGKCNLHLEGWDLWQRCGHCGKKHGFVTEYPEDETGTTPPEDEKDGPPADDPLPVCEEHEVIKKLESILLRVRNGRGLGVTPKFTKDLSTMVHMFEAVINLEILSNNAMVRECCPICYEGHKEADIPYWIFSDNEGICYNCAASYASELLEIVKAVNAYYWIKDDDDRVSDGHQRMGILAPVLSDKEKVKLWGADWKAKLADLQANDMPF